MAVGVFPRGSEWRRWDLHVHTPFSVLNQGFGTNFDAYAKTLLQRAVAAEIAAIGVVDYFSIEGYSALRALVADGHKMRALLGAELAKRAAPILLLPNIELRTSVLVRRTDGRDSRVNFHVLFADSLDPRLIDEHFLRALKFTCEGNPGGPDESRALTRENLKDLGRQLKAQHAKFRDHGDLYVGMMNAVVSHEDVTAVLETQPSRFRDRYLILVPADEDLAACRWDGQGHLVRKLLLQKAHMLLSANDGTRAFALGKKHSSVKAFVEEFKSLKPCVHGSDAHRYEELFEAAGRKYLWIKADPTYDGLRQLLHEPEGRLFLGEMPPALQRVREAATKYMDAVAFSRTGAPGDGDEWFSGALPLNHGLVAIIGNKGSGKSALADTLALLGNTHNTEFSFLNAERFLAPATGLGAMFSADVAWCSGTSRDRTLDKPVDLASPELVKYIPQNYLERICTELKESSETDFDLELREVIFSHVTEAARLGKSSLTGLIEYLTKEKEERIRQLVSELSSVNSEIVSLEEHSTPEYRRSLEGQLAVRRGELDAHDRAKPAAVPEPTVDSVQQASQLVVKEIEALQGTIESREKELADLQGRVNQLAHQLASAEKLLVRLENLERQVNGVLAESADDCRILGVDITKVAALILDRQPIYEAQQRASDEIAIARQKLSAEGPGSLASLQGRDRATVEAKRQELDEPSRRYHAYLEELATWQTNRDRIQGSAIVPGSVAGLESLVKGLDTLPELVASRREARVQLVREIFDTKQALLADYRKLYAPVQTFIDRHPLSKEQSVLEFSASMSVEDLDDRLLDLLHQGRKGSFQGDEEGRRRLAELVAAANFSDADGILEFLATLQEHLEFDKREVEGRPARIKDQLRAGFSVGQVYDLVYGLDYLKPRFELRWQGKRLDQLSPGERGTLLLVFYLLIDKRDVPLIVDQPEENLDNHTIASLLVPAIKEAKERRQIVIVTHNPNLAVVCDADQVIHARLEKKDQNRLIYISGSLENPTIAQLIVDVLEGTKPAFDLRDAKYGLLERH